MTSDTAALILAARDAGRSPVWLTPIAPLDPLGGPKEMVLFPLEANSANQGSDTRALSALQALEEDRAVSFEHAGVRWLARPFNPPARLIVVGAVHVAQALVPMATQAGLAVTVVDPRPQWINEFRFPNVEQVRAWPEEAFASLQLDHRCAVVTLTHDPKVDDPALTAALASPAFYIGALGSRRTHQKRMDRLGESGIDPAALRRIHSPVGIDIGARGPAEIAVSVLAEVIQALRTPTV